MRFFAVLILFTCLVCPVFSQNNPHMQRYTSLGDSLSTLVTRTNAKLANYDSMIKDDGANKVFTSYIRKYNFLTSALNESELKLDLLLRTFDRSEVIKEERDNYESLTKQLQTLKSEYDSWIRTVQ